MKDAVINGNILTVFKSSIKDICAFALINEIEAFSVHPDDEGYKISFPITKETESNIPGILHGARARLRAAENDANNENPTPPKSA